MNKKCLIILKGYELMQEIANKRIKEGTKFRDLTDNDYTDNNIYRYENNNFIGRWGGTNIIKLLKHDFEILGDEEEIDIQGIDIIRDYRTSDDDLYNDNFDDFKSTINDLVKAVKQLDKKINKED